MKRMKITARSTLAAATGLLAIQVHAQQDLSNVRIETVSVADGLYMLVGQGGNIGLSVGDDGAMIVDTQFAPLSERIQAAVTAAGGGEVELVVNTHWHGDHTGGNPEFGDAGAFIMAHANVRTRLAAAEDANPAGFPNLTYPDQVRLDWNGGEVDLLHVPPAHTDGDTIVHFTSLNAVHMGDTFFNGVYPFIDVDSGGSFDGLIAAGERVLELANDQTRIMPGHGPLASRADLEAWIGVLGTIRDRFQSLIDDGLDVDQIVAAGVTAEWDEAMGGGFMNAENFTRLAVQSLMQ
jgi:glyoxylase-like metal-dependent hydrolase (beta-lactamase superfamily II)